LSAPHAHEYLNKLLLDAVSHKMVLAAYPARQMAHSPILLPHSTSRCKIMNMHNMLNYYY